MLIHQCDLVQNPKNENMYSGLDFKQKRENVKSLFPIGLCFEDFGE